MGFGEVAVTLMLFTGSIVIAAGVVGMLGVVVQDIASSGETRGKAVAERLRTDVEVINDPAQLPSPLKFYVKNTGSSILDPNVTTLIVDGVARTAATFTVQDPAQAGWWRPGEVMEAADATLSLAAGDHTVTVVVGGGVRDSLRVRA